MKQCNVLTDDATSCPMPSAQAYDHHDGGNADVQTAIELFIRSEPRTVTMIVQCSWVAGYADLFIVNHSCSIVARASARAVTLLLPGRTRVLRPRLIGCPHPGSRITLLAA